MLPFTHNEDSTDSGDELVFNTLGTSIDEAFGIDEEADEVEEDDYSEGDYE